MSAAPPALDDLAAAREGSSSPSAITARAITSDDSFLATDASPPMPRASRPLAALGWMLLASALFAGMNVSAKHAMRELPWHEVATGRALFGALAVYGIARARGTPLRVFDRRTQWMRTLAGIGSLCFGFYALAHLALGDQVTLGQLSPLLVAIASKRALDERAGASLYLAIAFGLAGVVLLTGARFPGGTPDAAAVLPLASGVAAAFAACIAMLFLRRLGPRESAEGVSLHFLGWSSVACFVVGLGRHVVPSPGALLALVLAGSFGGAAQIAMTRAYGLDKAARVGAVGYSGIVMAQLLGVVFFAEIPTGNQLLGALLVIVSGLVLVWSALRERSAARRSIDLAMRSARSAT